MAADVLLQSTRSGVRIVLDGTSDFQVLREALARRLGPGPSLSGAPVTVVPGAQSLDTDQLGELERLLLAEHGASVLQVLEAGELSEGAARNLLVAAAAAGAGVEPAGDPTDLATAPTGADTLLVRRTLRSGQRVRFAGNVVVLGDVNPGAEIVAGGDIVIMGTLRGVAHAGARGGGQAVVAAFRLQPTQVRVGAVIGRAPDGPAERPQAPEVARVRDGVLVVERLQPAMHEA